VPFTVHQRGFPFTTFKHKATLLIGANSPTIVSEHTHRDTMQLQAVKGKSQNETHCLSSNAPPKALRIENAYGKRCAPILHVNAI